jgi:hypothetical protein
MHRRLPVGVLTLVITIACAGLSPAMASAETITGHVTGPLGEDLDDICVAAHDTVDASIPGGIRGTATTGTDGLYTLPVGTDDNYKVSFSSFPGCAGPNSADVVTEYWNNKPDHATADFVPVPDGGTAAGINAQLAFTPPPPNQGSIAGTVRNIGAVGIANVCVFALDDADPLAAPFASDQTDSNGDYEITLTADNYKLGFTTNPMFCLGVTTRIADEYYQDTTVFANATIVPVTGGNTTDNIDATLETLATANDDSPAAVNEDSTANNFAVLANDVDGDSTGANEVTAVSDPPNGTAVKVDAVTDSVNYTPDANFCGADTFTYTITGGDTATVTVTVTCVNDPPAGANGTVTTNEDTDHVFTAANFGFTDADAGDSMSVVRVDSLPAQGTLRLDNGLVSPSQLIPIANLNAGQFTYTPPANGCGSPLTSFTFSVRDSSSTYDPSPNTLTVNVTCQNDPPAGTDGAVTTSEDTDHAFAGSDFGFTDPDTGTGDALSGVRIDTLPAQGTLKLSNVAVVAPTTVTSAQLAAGNLTYTPPANVCGVPFTTFTFSVRDGSSVFDTSPNTLTVNVTCVDDAPVADDDGTTTVAEDSGATSIAVLGNDDDIDAGPMEIQSVTNPSNGSASIVQGSPDQVAYMPDPNFCGSDSFKYTLNGGDDANVPVTVTCSDDAPKAVADSPAVAEDSGASTIDVLANDTDIDAGPKTVASKSDGNNGTVTITNSGANVSYTPNANYCGADSFTYTLNGGSSATVTVAVTCVDDAPAAVNDSATVAEDAAATAIDVLANDTDADGGPKTVASATDAPHGTVATTATGLTYRPDANYCGPDSFTYALNGGSSATVAVTVTCVADPVPDTEAPQTTITKGPKAKLRIRRAKVTVKFAFTSSEAGSTFRCKLDKGAFRACSSPKSYKLKPGRHVFTVVATDAAGNVDSTPAKRKVRVIRA